MSLLTKRLISTVAAMLLFVVGVCAEVLFKANVPLLVGEGEPFPVEFTLNAKPKDDSFVAPSFDGFNLVAGPSISTGQSIQVVNNKMSRTVNNTYTYVLIAERVGNYTIPSAEVVVDGKRYTTDPMPIEVVKENTSSAASTFSATTSQRSQQSERDRASSRIGAEDLFLKMDLSRESVYKGEPIRATLKLYSRVDIVNNENLKLPSFNGFWAQDISDKRSITATRESYQDRVYDTYAVREYLLYPQQAGELVIEPAQIDIVAQIVVQSRNVDPFFGGGHDFYNVRRHLETQSRTIDVKQLPAGEPASFSGAVGQFQIEMLPLSSSSIEVNSASTIKVKVSGSGNVTFIQAPKLDLPNSFELYNVRTTESIRTESSGAVGYKEFEYPFIARAEGDYTIPEIEFSYFNPQNNSYNVVKTTPFSITVTSDGKSMDSATIQRISTSKVNIEMLASDIRFIKLCDGQFHPKQDPFILSMIYYILIVVIVMIYITTYFVVKKVMRDRKNVAARRGKMANKMAIQRFKAAKRYMDERSEQPFYEEMLRGLWGYMSDKLNIPVSDLTKEYVREELLKRECSVDLVQEFSDIITICDEAQYSPMASSQMSDVYGRGLEFVSRIEAFVKRGR